MVLIIGEGYQTAGNLWSSSAFERSTRSAGPSSLTAHTLRLDPRWDPIRDHPRFKELVAKYGSGAAL